MNITIAAAKPDRDIAEYLDTLQHDLRDQNGLCPQVTKSQRLVDEKAIDLPLAISLASLTVSTVNMIVGILKFQKDTDPSVTLKLSRGEKTLEIKNATPEMIKAFLDDAGPDTVKAEIDKI